MPLFTLDELADAAAIVRRVVSPTPAYAWPLLAKAAGAEVVVKHENHTPTGSFKARGGLVYVDALLRAGPRPQGICHRDARQSRPIGCRRGDAQRHSGGDRGAGGQFSEKNAAMAAFGGEVVTAGKDFDESRGVAAADPARARLSFRAVVSPRAGEGRGDLCA